jgi:hypothetical protein
MKNLTKSLIAAAVLATSAMSHAAPVITWNVAVTGLWTDFAPSGVTRSADKTLLSWGTPSIITDTGQSSLLITNPEATNINTFFGIGDAPAGFIAPSIALTHSNQPITGTLLRNATATVGVKLTPVDPEGAVRDLQDIDYVIKFKETPNNVAVTDCADLTSLIACNDIFVLRAGDLGSTFDYDGFRYFVSAFPTEGGTLRFLTDRECAAASEDNGCVGFTTPERATTRLAFGLTISGERLEVPEPGSLALLGLGLAGLAAATRRKQKQA